MEINELVAGLRSQLVQGEPWSEDLTAELSRLRPVALLAILRELEVRSLIHKHDHILRDKNVNDVLRQQWRWHRGDTSHGAIEMIMALRDQYTHAISAAADNFRRRLMHAYQVEMTPSQVRARMGHFVGISFVPGRHLAEFPADETFVDISHPQVVTLSLRRHRLNSRRVIDMYDIKMHALEVEPDSGVVQVGGVAEDHFGKPYSRTTVSRYFNYILHDEVVGRGRTPADHLILADIGLALHQAVERVVVSGAHVQTPPAFPEIFLGFATADAVAMEHSDGLKACAHQAVDRWFRNGKPSTWLAFPEMPVLADELRYRPGNWAGVIRQLGDKHAGHILDACWVNNNQRAVGLHLTPLAFFKPYSPQRPVRRAIRVLAHFPAYIMGQEQLLPTGETVINDRLARPQVVPADMVGQVGCVEYDFTAVRHGMEKYFKHARE